MPAHNTHIFRGWSTAAAIRLRTVVSPFTTSVWPALCPPCQRTTMSARAASRSTTLPLPSSPHWVPMMAVAPGMIPSEPQQLGGDDLRQRAHLVEDRGWHGIVDVEEREGHAADVLATELQACDVDLVLAQERAHAADHARHVAVVQ